MTNQEKLKETAVELLFTLTLSNFAFSRKVRKEIKKKSACDQCKFQAPRHQLIAAHINHDQNLPTYNTKENGRCLCAPCEARFHLRHAFSGHEIGLRSEDAICSAKSSFTSLPYPARRQLRNEFPDTVAKLLGEK